MFFGVKRERELFLLSEGLVKTSDDDDVFRGMHPKKSLCPKTNKTTGKKAKLLSLLSFFFPFLSSFLFSLFSRFLTTKNFFHLSSCTSRFHFKRKTHLSSLRAQFRAHTSSRAETPPLCCSAFLQYYKECFERKEREKRARCLWLYVACIVLIGEKSTRR